MVVNGLGDERFLRSLGNREARSFSIEIIISQQYHIDKDMRKGHQNQQTQKEDLRGQNIDMMTR